MSDHSGQQIVILTTSWWWQNLHGFKGGHMLHETSFAGFDFYEMSWLWFFLG
jgi:hypothetical protein